MAAAVHVAVAPSMALKQEGLHATPQQQEKHDYSNTNTKSIRFFEYASVIPLLDPEQLHEHIVQAYGHHGRPHLSSRTYSVPIPTSFTQLFAPPPPREYTYDPSFIPNAPPRLNLRLPSFVRKRRNTISCSQPHLKSCLKKRKIVLGANVIDSKKREHSIDAIKDGKRTPTPSAPGAPAARGRAHTMASSAPVSAPSASCSISNFNPLYCPALAKLASESQSFESSADSASSNLSSSPQTPPSASPPKDGEQTPVHHLPPAPTELLPIRDCCRACRRAAAYGERCSDAEYHENWSKAALEKRKRDEETLFERGEYINRKRSQGEIVDEAEMNEPGQREVHDVEVLEKEARHHPIPHHHSPLHSPSHTQLSSPLHSPSDEVHEEKNQGRNSPAAAGPSCVLAQAHAHIVAHHEARQQKAAAHAQEIDDARQRIAKLDVGKMTRREEEDEEADSDSDSAKSSPTEGGALQLEGVDGGLSTSPKSAKLDLAQSPKSRQKRLEQEENEKNPICTLDGRVLRPCSSRSTYTGGPAIASQLNEADRASNASSSDLSDDIVSNLSSLGLSPASATTAASSWFGGEEMQSPPLTRSMKEGSTEHDCFALSGREEEKEEMKEVLAEPVKLTSPSSGSGATGCSPLMRSKACLRPAALYNPSAAEDLMTQSCPTIKEEKSLPPSPGIATMPNNTLQRIHTASSALEKEAELREALKEADKPLFPKPSRTQSLPADAGRSPLQDEGSGRKRTKQSWTSRILHRGKGLSSLGVAHGIVH